MSTPVNPKLIAVPWWMRGRVIAPGRTPLHPFREQAVSEHPHWQHPKTPGRTVLRQQARRLRSATRAGKR